MPTIIKTTRRYILEDVPETHLPWLGGDIEEVLDKLGKEHKLAQIRAHAITDHANKKIRINLLAPEGTHEILFKDLKKKLKGIGRLREL